MPQASLSVRDWSLCLARLLECANDLERLPAAIMDALESLSPTQVTFLGLYRKGRRPLNLWSHPENIDASGYVGGTYRLDPFFAAYRDGRSGCFHLRTIAPHGFERSQYYQELYLKRGVADGLAHLTRLADGSTALAMLTRKEYFTSAEIKRHDDAHAVIAASSTHLARLAEAEDKIVHAPEEAIDDAFESFGSDILTPREHEVIHLVLRGHSTASAAGQLGIAEDTVKRHRLQAYMKLKVSSQGELFYEFLRTIGLRPDN